MAKLSLLAFLTISALCIASSSAQEHIEKTAAEKLPTVPLERNNSKPYENSKLNSKFNKPIVQSKSFDAYQWDANSNSRNYQWKKFLGEYDLIGMKKEQLLALLGKADWNTNSNGAILVDYPPMHNEKPGTIATYHLYSTNWCGNTSKSVQIRFDDNDKVNAWRLYGMYMDDSWFWFTKNMIFPPGKNWQFDKPFYGLVKK